jgi:hypothetical protein
MGLVALAAWWGRTDAGAAAAAPNMAEFFESRRKTP